MTNILSPPVLYDALAPPVITSLMAALKNEVGATPLAIAVSGGADSFAVLDILRHHFPPNQLRCLTVDHGLRTTSAAEATLIAQWCRTVGIYHQTLAWNPSAKPVTNLQAMARRARYRLLLEACALHGASHLITAHHADDQAETLLGRLARGAGVDGLAAMAPSGRSAAGPLQPVTVHRPFLCVRGPALKAYAQTHHLPVQEDPSNQSRNFERVRLRHMLQTLAAEGEISTRALCKAAAHQLAARHDLDTQIRDDFTRCQGFIEMSGAICLEHRRVSALSPSRQNRLLRRLCWAVSGHDYAPSDAPVAQALEQLRTKPKVSLGGVLLWGEGRGGGDESSYYQKLWVLREPAALLGRAGVVPLAGMPLRPESPVLWDNRCIIHAPSEAVTVHPLGRVFAGCPPSPLPSLPQEATARKLTFRGIIAHRLATLPAGFEKDICKSLPLAAKNSVMFAASPWRSALNTLHIEILTDERLFRPVMRF